MRALAFMAAEGLDAMFAGNPLAFIAKDHRIAIECDAQFRAMLTHGSDEVNEILGAQRPPAC